MRQYAMLTYSAVPCAAVAMPASRPPGCDTWRPLFVRRMLPPSGFRMITY